MGYAMAGRDNGRPSDPTGSRAAAHEDRGRPMTGWLTFLAVLGLWFLIDAVLEGE
jgi:hypothetical protein